MPLPATSGFVPVDPTRIYDSLTGGRLPLGPGQRLDLDVLGAGGVPTSGVGSVALTVTARWPTSTTWLAVWPAGAPKPASTMTVAAGTTRSALAVSAVGGNGLVSLRNSAGVTEVAVDVVGYYPTAAASGQTLHMVRPFRLYDSRVSDGILRGDTGRSITLPSYHGIASSRMGAAILNVTALSASGAGDVVVHRPGSGLSDAVTLTYPKTTKVASRAVTALADGALRVSVRGGDTHVVVDVVGWYAPTSVAGGKRFQATTPRRVLDTNSGIGAPKAAVRRDGTIVLPVAGTGRALPVDRQSRPAQRHLEQHEDGDLSDVVGRASHVSVLVGQLPHQGSSDVAPGAGPGPPGWQETRQDQPAQLREEDQPGRRHRRLLPLIPVIMKDLRCSSPTDPS